MMSNEQMAEISDVVAGYVNGCPNVAVKSAIDMALVNWIRDVRNLTHICGPIKFANCRGAYDVCAPFGGAVIGVRKLFTSFAIIPVQSWSVIDSDCGKKILFRCPIPTFGPDEFHALVEWMPTKDTDELPDVWFQANKKAVVDSVLTFLLSQNKPWADVNTAAHFSRELEKDRVDAIYAAKAEGEAGGQLSFFDPQTTFSGIMF